MSNAISGFIGGVINGVGSLASGGKTVENQVKNQQQIYGASGESESLEAQRKMNKDQDHLSAEMTNLQNEANSTKKIADTAMMIQQGREQSWGKAMSSAAKTVDGINF
ncbi:hypothetical protein [Pseudomonas rossensis]|uniref:hypothetical protein n=1 Tax=Pseudomonas rossensis TaxID=2305471 RepID=UPI003261447A